jgi:acyl-CoA reductase-like NAD-dependent aldehyde dehydrogenase
VLGFDTLDEAITRIDERPHPLAFYYFDDSPSRADEVLRRVKSGGAVLNDCLVHFAQEALPFGGVGASGMGSYHGRDGFRTFSHAKAVFRQSRINGLSLFSPPYGKRFDALLKFLLG